MNISRRTRALACIASVATLLATAGGVLAQNTNAKIANTRHNLSSSATTNRVYSSGASSTNQICVFCHTPHAANSAAPAPLWNRALNTVPNTYTPYTSNSLDAEDILNGSIGQPGGASKLCLSCHDGTLAIGQVANSPGSGTGRTISMTGTNAGNMPDGDGASATTGYTRNLGINLTNDHPISFTFQSAAPNTDTLSQRDGELRSPPYLGSSTAKRPVVGIRSSGVKPMLPLDHEGKVQCTSCHDPHLTASKFLRLNRFQANASSGQTFDPANDQICLGCHDRNKDANAWANSAHANTSVATYSYKAAAATQREFPDGISFGSPVIKVWEAGCLNCHDTHTVQGSRRLLREGTNSTASPKAGGKPAIEQTCYQCHTDTTSSILTVSTMTATAGVPNIRTEFETSGNYHMPITDTEQHNATTEPHDIGGGFNDATFIDCTGATNKCGTDFIESRAKLGVGNVNNRHVECTDCHNPHRVLKNALFNGSGSATRRTHVPGGANGNLASGALRGMWGVEPAWNYSGNWPAAPSTYDVKRGDPGGNGATTKAQTFLTREYQLCLKCHSDYGFTTPPPTGYYTGGTSSTTNNIGNNYTNIAAELGVNATDSPTGTRDQGEYGKCSAGCGTNYTDIEPSGSSPADTTNARMADDTSGVQNHRSWHPLHYPTGRSWAERRIGDTAGSNFRAPFNGTDSTNGLGVQTMHCSDCHGNGTTSWTQNTGPDLTKVQGPHGSTNPFILRGPWSTSVTVNSTNNATDGLCFNCHNPTPGSAKGSSDDGTNRTSGFNNHGTNSQGGHGNAHDSKPCMRCHVAVPHGWKNKALLVNLNCRGPEAGATVTCDDTSGYGGYPDANAKTYTQGPYYNASYLRVYTWRASGNWSETSCGATGADKPYGKDWMTNGGNC